jgi:serine/threonine protein kinase
VTNKLLGSGSYGAVHVGFWCGVDVAVKTFHESLRLPQLAPYFMRELSICSQLHHPNVVPICGAVMENNIPIQIVMELLQGSLSDLIKAALIKAAHASSNYLRYLSLREQIDVAGNIAAAITYMHQLRPKPYVHCDIRSTNVMVTSTMVAKVGDLGASHVLDSTKSMGALSCEYIAPERMPGHDGSSPRSSRESDVYSLGVTLIELFTGLTPIPDDRKNQLHLIKHVDLLSMCRGMIREKPGERLLALECLDILMKQKAGESYKMLPGRRAVRGNLEGETMSIVDM